MIKIPYYILYPNDNKLKVKITTVRPNPKTAKKVYGFAEGSFSSKKAVISRLNMMNISVKKRPKGYQKI